MFCVWYAVSSFVADVADVYAGDPFYDSDENIASVDAWFAEHVKQPLAAHGIGISLAYTSLHNTLKKPGPVFLAMAREVYDKYHADYYYRVNDDTEMIDRWPKAFVGALRSLPPPYGVVGPTCLEGNTKILTHDFVHKTHMEVFDMNYYPPALVDWWMDDWYVLCPCGCNDSGSYVCVLCCVVL